MLVLKIPIHIGKYKYDLLKGGIKGEWDWRNRTISSIVSLARSRNGQTIIGTIEKDGDQERMLPPPVIATYPLQDPSPPDPTLATVFQKLHELNEAVEAHMVATGALAKQVYQVGEEEVSLDCTFVASSLPGQTEEKEKKPKDDEKNKK